MNCRKMGLGEVWSDLWGKKTVTRFLYIYLCVCVCTFFFFFFFFLPFFFSLLNLIVQETKRGRTNLLDYINTNLNTSLISYDFCT